ncbi:MAG: response regulator transcription factor [Oscillospiraceae bacterium]
MRILIIEDDASLSKLMSQGLDAMGFCTDIASDGTMGEEKIELNTYDAVLLDLNLPDMDGLEVLSNIRKAGNNLPVIIVSARNDVMQRTNGLDLGADDYIVKPFDFSELRARIQAVIRRFYGRSNADISIGDLTINPSIRSISFCGKKLELSAKEFDILEFLASSYPHPVSAEEIIEHVYNEEFDEFSSVLRVHMANLRKKIGRVYSKPVIETLKGKGYRICL